MKKDEYKMSQQVDTTDYKQKYKEALERAKNYCDGHHTDVSPKAMSEYLFPELRESEDERIREWIIKYLQYWNTNASDEDERNNCKNAISWLEKQGKNKDQNNRIYIQKFNIGNTVCRQGWSDHTIEKIYNDGKFGPVYICKNEEGLESHISFSEQDEWKLKDRIQPQPKQEWSEEDKRMLDNIIFELEENQEHISGVTYKIDWLKSLKPNHWKPSEQNINDLEWCADLVKDKMGVGFHRLQIFIDELKNL